MDSKNSLREFPEEDFDKVAAGQTNHIAIVIRSSDQTIIQTGGSQLDVITNNVQRVSHPIGKH
jgi:hypothetical protein